MAFHLGKGADYERQQDSLGTDMFTHLLFVVVMLTPFPNLVVYVFSPFPSRWSDNFSW